MKIKTLFLEKSHKRSTASLKLKRKLIIRVFYHKKNMQLIAQCGEAKVYQNVLSKTYSANFSILTNNHSGTDVNHK